MLSKHSIFFINIIILIIRTIHTHDLCVTLWPNLRSLYVSRKNIWHNENIGRIGNFLRQARAKWTNRIECERLKAGRKSVCMWKILFHRVEDKNLTNIDSIGWCLREENITQQDDIRAMTSFAGNFDCLRCYHVRIHSFVHSFFWIWQRMFCGISTMNIINDFIYWIYVESDERKCYQCLLLFQLQFRMFSDNFFSLCSAMLSARTFRTRSHDGIIYWISQRHRKALSIGHTSTKNSLERIHDFDILLCRHSLAWSFRYFDSCEREISPEKQRAGNFQSDYELCSQFSVDNLAHFIRILMFYVPQPRRLSIVIYANSEPERRVVNCHVSPYAYN